MNMHEHDDDFDLRLAKRERLLPQFDAELEGPDADTDRLLIARARSASHPVQLRSPASKTFRAPRWAVPVGLAATLVLSFTLLLHSDPASVTGSVTGSVIEPAVSDAAPSENAVSEAAVDDAVAGASAPAEAFQRQEERAAKAMPAAPAPAPILSPAPPPPAMVPPAMADEASASVVMSASALPSAAARDVGAADASMERARASAPRDPDTWLQRIEQLRSQGLEAEARQELLSFRQQYPEHPLPAALQALLPAP